MVSSKGEPTDPKLREEVKQDVMQQTNKDGSGKGQPAAWKASKIAKTYEAKGGDYKNTPGSKNKPKKGPPEKKFAEESIFKEETLKNGNAADERKTENAKPKAKNGQDGEKKNADRASKSGNGASKKKAEPEQGQRRSTRQAGTKRKSSDGGESASGSSSKKSKTEH